MSVKLTGIKVSLCIDGAFELLRHVCNLCFHLLQFSVIHFSKLRLQQYTALLEIDSQKNIEYTIRMIY